jgi:hypothetical protein
MTPDPPPSSSDGQSLPPRHRPPLEHLSKDTTELDLWSFGEDLELGDLPPTPTASSRASGNEIPAPREKRVTKAREPSNPLDSPSKPTGGERIQMNVNKTRPHPHSGIPPVGLSRTESEFDDLEHWEDIPKGPQIDDLPPVQESVLETTASEFVGTPPEEIAIAEAAASLAPQADVEVDEFSPVKRSDAKPLSLQPHLRLSRIERIGLIALLSLLVAGGLATIMFSLIRLPTESARVKTNDFPIRGAMVEVGSAISYWRAPITDGSSPEIVRRGTKLLPVLELQIGGGSGAVRILFRDENRTAVGDAVTHAVRGAGTLIIPATAGFDDFGMHAAYRTGGSKPWTIEVFEAASETAAGKDFKTLFEMNISTDRR